MMYSAQNNIHNTVKNRKKYVDWTYLPKEKKVHCEYKYYNTISLQRVNIVESMKQSII